MDAEINFIHENFSHLLRFLTGFQAMQLLISGKTGILENNSSSGLFKNK